MRKTTITVAAFMAVAAASYAAVTPPNAGYEFTIAKGKKEASQTFSLKEGTYSISIKESKGSIKVDDKDYLAGNILTVEAAKDVKITVMFDAKDQDEMFTLTIVPTTEAWTKWLADQQTIITNLMSEASNLGKGAGTAPYMKPEDKSIEAGWRTDLISRISDIQKAKNACGIVEYNEWLANGKTSVNSLSGLDQLKKDVNDKTANHNAYQYAINTFKENKEKGGDLDYSELTKEYTGSAANGLFIDTYETLIKEIDGVEANAWDVYIAGNAAANYDAQKLATLISGLKGRIDKLTEAITNGSDQYANWIAVDGAVNSAIASYNEQFNNLYSQLAASTLQEGYGKDIYNDYYEDAVKELNAILAKIYAVKNANDAAKEAYDKDKKHNINGLDYYELNAGWEVKNIKQSLADVYSKYVTTGADGVVPANTLRGAYKDHITTIGKLREDLKQFDTAKADTDTDKKGNSIGEYFTVKVNDLNTAINNLKKKVIAANKNHKKDQTIADFDIDTEGKKDIDSKMDNLKTQKAAYGKYADTRAIIDKLENTTFAKAKEDVGKLNYEEFNANDRFSNAHIVTAISDFRTAAREKYMVGATDYNYVDCETKNNKIERQITTWQTDATNAFDKYKAINDAIDAYELEINGRAEDAATGVVEIKSWASVVLNENVTVGGDLTSDTYGAKKAAADLVVATAQNKLNDAMAVPKEKEDDFKTALDAACNEKTKLDAKTTEIQNLKYRYQYTDDALVWQNKTSWQAAKDARDESLSLTGACMKAANAIPSYSGDDYGTAAAATLNEKTESIKEVLGTIEGKITGVKIPDSYDPSFNKDKAATAIAQINDIKLDLAKVNADIENLQDTIAPAAKENFTAVKNDIADIKDLINGNAVAKIESIENLLLPASNDAIDEAITTLKEKADDLWKDLDAASDVADARKDKPKDGETPAVVGLDTRCENLLKKVNDYRTKAENESKNKKNLIAWDAFLNNPYNTTPATSAQDIIDANKNAIDNALENSTSDGEKYFQGLIGDDSKGKQKEFKDIKDTVDDLYDNKLAAPNDAFTDPANNLTDAKLKENKDQVLAILKAVKTYPGLAKANEEAYDAQDSAYTVVLGKYEELRLQISSDKPSGDKFTASYNKALEELTRINDALEKYNTDKESNYKVGASDAFDAKATLSVIKGINTKITALEEKWTGDELKEGSYLKAVADDNAARYTDFLSALDELKVAYYGKTDGTDHIDGAIDIVSKLSSLSYADQVDPEEYEKLVEGPDGLYQYAEKIADLASRASTNKDATKAPAFWDVDRTFKEEATAMKNIVNSKKNEYAALVNAEADSTYNTWIGDVEGKLKKARTALTDTKLAANDTQADNLLRAVTSPSLGKSVVDIHDEAIQAYNSGTPVADFAYKLDKEFLPVSAEVQHLIDTAMDKAAGEAWEAMCEKVDTITDATNMQAFMWNADYKNAKDLTTFVKGAAPTDFEFSKIVYEGEFAGYATAKSKYIAAVDSRTIDGVQQTHTKEYWAAYDSNEKYKTLVADDQALQAAISTLTDSLNAAEIAIKSLLVEHDETLASLIGTYRRDIGRLNNADGAASIQDKITVLNGMAIRKEMQAVNIELTNMRSYIELNVEEAKRAELIAKADELQKKNEDIYNLFSVGTGVPLVTATAETTYSEYQKIEKEIGALKTSFDTTVANAAAEVAAAIAELDGKYSEFETLYNSTFTQTQDHYANDKSAVKAQIANLKAKVAAQGDAISIEKTNNLKAVEKAETSISTLSADVTAYNQGYVDNDNFVKAQLAVIEGYEKDLADVVAKGLALKNKKPAAGNKLYINVKNAEISDAIDGYEAQNNTHVNGAKDYLNALINSVKTSSYDTKKDAVVTAINDIKADITTLEKDVLKYDLTQESTNVEKAITDLQNEINARIPEGASLRATLTAKVNAQADSVAIIDAHNYEVVNEYWHNVNEQWVQWSVVAEHEDVMSSYSDVLKALSDIEGRIVTPGAIGDKETVTSDDIESMIRFILNPSEAEGMMDVADIDEDEKVTVADLTKVKNYYLYNNYAGYTPSSSAVRAYPTAVVAGSLDMAVNGSFLNVSLDTQVGYAAIQLDVTLPAGVVLTDAAFAGATEGVQAMYNKIGENTWRVLLFSEDNSNLVDGTDLLSLGLAGKGYGNVNIGNAMGSNTRGILIPIPGDSDDIDISTGIEAPAEIAGGNSFFYGINAAMQRSFEKGVNIVKEAGKKAIKVLQRK